MPTYYVHIPDSEAPTAEVNASSTKHARTTYLDYLSRNSIISWRERQSTRSLVRASRMQPGEIRTQVQLDYDMSPEPEAVIEEAPQALAELSPEEEERYKEYNMGAAEGLTAEEQRKFTTMGGGFAPTPEQPIKPQVSPLADSPIVKLSRKSRGM